VSPDEPEPQIAAHAILGLWRVQNQAVRRYADDSDSPEEFRDRVTADVHRAAMLLEAGLWSFGAMLKGGNSREQLKAAAEAAQQAGRQVSTAIRHAKSVWNCKRTQNATRITKRETSTTVGAGREVLVGAVPVPRVAVERCGPGRPGEVGVLARGDDPTARRVHGGMLQA
jgi:leucyl aminopeptidase (aminopeptidase T)